MQSEWTETLTLLVKLNDFEEAGDRIQSVAREFDLAINGIKMRQRLAWTMIRLLVSLTGRAGRISDFRRSSLERGGLRRRVALWRIH
jgi:hypothetical protein